MSFEAGRTLKTVGLTVLGLVGAILAQDVNDVRPRFIVVPPRPALVETPPGSGLPLWNGSFTYQGTKYTFQMVGTNPANTNKTTTIPTFFIPIKMIYNASHGNKTFDPNQAKFKGTTISVSQTILTSPIFNAGVNFEEGGTDLGNTQYIDAFQRGNFWGKNVKKNNKYHILLGKPTVLPERTINCTTSACSVIVNPITHKGLVGTEDVYAFDGILNTYLAKFSQIHPNALPIFLTYDTYLTDGGICCVGGFHSASGNGISGQTYAYATAIDQGAGVFSQDTAALSHEVGEWADDPLINGGNNTPCGVLEVGDPLVLHDYPYTLHGFTYHLQDIVWLPYFGAPKSTSLLGWLTFQNEFSSVCQNGPAAAPSKSLTRETR
jgi:hypothetical protein